MEGRRIYVKHPSYDTDSLMHSGVKGMHWGERLYQYPDGSLTPLGRIHYGIGAARKTISEHVKREQNEDGTLTLRGKIKYKTTDKYKLMSDDDLKKQANRLQLQKNLEGLKKETSTSYRLKTRLEGVAEDAIVSGSKKALEKIVNNFVDKKVGDLLNVDKDAIAESRKQIEGLSKKEIDTLLNKYKAEANFIEFTTGKKVPTGHKFMGLTDKEKEGMKKSENKPENQEQNGQRNPSKSEEVKPSEKKPEEIKPTEEKKESKSSEKKPEEKKSGATVTVKRENKTSEKKLEEKKSGATVTVKRENKTSEKKPEKNNSLGTEISQAKINVIRAMKRQGRSINDIAREMKLSPSTVEKYVKG